jgi:hypothetical protein
MTAVNRIDTGQHIRQRGLSGAVLTDQGVNLTLVDIERNILHRLGNTEGFAEVLNL